MLGLIDPGHREILVLREIDGRSYDEIAEILDTEAGTVKSRLHRARAALREKLRGVWPP
jgi:RNA polymerase sigma-70 factor (ECF subfamily)